ncbi:hypothetical protein M011DRAFT_17227 [Sporormia fimetaria CBS 119925]|uniref:Uncharacterized protein n=1 Tax=Sporormia fimetaria CBS 119925 TaxID=1340428 RepID=A0A6A6VRD2_9PLEO|nr:hypothetical protein M011DRAFT_17227 [Sporormia fimetaria CBS 119925]
MKRHGALRPTPAVSTWHSSRPLSTLPPPLPPPPHSHAAAESWPLLDGRIHCRATIVSLRLTRYTARCRVATLLLGPPYRPIPLGREGACIIRLTRYPLAGLGTWSNRHHCSHSATGTLHAHSLDYRAAPDRVGRFRAHRFPCPTSNRCSTGLRLQSVGPALGAAVEIQARVFSVPRHACSPSCVRPVALSPRPSPAETCSSRDEEAAGVACIESAFLTVSNDDNSHRAC